MRLRAAGRKARALARQVGGAGIAPVRERLLEDPDRVLDGDEGRNVGFGKVEGVDMFTCVSREWSEGFAERNETRDSERLRSSILLKRASARILLGP